MIPDLSPPPPTPPRWSQATSGWRRALLPLAGLLALAGALAALHALSADVRPGDLGPQPGVGPASLPWLAATAALFGLAATVYVAGAPRRPRPGRRDSLADAVTNLAFVVGAAITPLFLLYVLLSFVDPHAGDELAALIITPATLFLAVFVQDVLLLLAVWLRVVRAGVFTWRQLGLRRDRLRRDLALGAVGGMVVVAISSGLEVALASVGVEQTQGAMFPGGGGSPLELGMLAVALLGLAPFTEEVFFRGYLFRSLLLRRGAGYAYLATSAIFALVHLNLPALLPIFAVGLALAFLARRSRSLVPGIVAHAINNAVALASLIWAGW